jgi:hypothetical protein
MESQTVLTLMQQKLAILREVLQVTQDEVLLVDLEGLTPLLERKEALIREIQLIDEALTLHEALPPPAEVVRAEMVEVVQAVLENERTLEARMNLAHSRLRQELRELDRESRLKQYLERVKPKGATVDLKK